MAILHVRRLCQPNPLTTGPDYIRFFLFFITTLTSHFWTRIEIKRDINQQDLEIVDPHIFSKLDNFYSLEVVDRASETQLQVGENSNKIICGLKG